MSRYYFNTHGSSSILDQDGVDLSGLDDARRIAIRHLGEIFRDEVEKLETAEDWRLEVLDEGGKPVFEIKIHLHPPAANVFGGK